jgi:hypothetical protein
LQENKLLELIAEKVENRYYGKYRGKVVDNNDPESLGRLKVKVPDVLGNDVVTGWAMPCVPCGGAAGQGFLAIPEVDASVWIEFEKGELDHPIWVGTFWSKPGGDTELPKPNNPDGSEQGSVQSPPTRKIFKTVKGHTIQLEDADGDEMILIVEATNGHVVIMNKDGIKVVDGANGHEITLDSTGVTITDGVSAGNKITMAGAGVTVEDKNGNKVVMAAGGIKVGSSSSMEPFVLGNQFNVNVTSFLQMLNAHVHVGNLGAPTGLPVPPMMLQVPLSPKNMTE